MNLFEGNKIQQLHPADGLWPRLIRTLAETADRRLDERYSEVLSPTRQSLCSDRQ